MSGAFINLVEPASLLGVEGAGRRHLISFSHFACSVCAWTSLIQWMIGDKVVPFLPYAHSDKDA